MIPCLESERGVSRAEALALVRPEEQAVGVQIDRVQVGFPFQAEVEAVDRHRMVSAVPSGAVLLVFLDLV
jgi:hypothetical protein